MSYSETATDEDAPPSKHTNLKEWGMRIVKILFFIVVMALLYNLVKNIEWNEVKQALKGYELTQLFFGIALTAISYCIFSSYDLLGKYYVKHNIPARQVLPLGIICYASNLNLSSWIGSIALRYRLYSRLGLETQVITKILSISLITNWLGYIILAGSIFSFRLIDIPDDWKIGTTALRLLGFVLLAIAALYFIACQFSKRRNFQIKKYEIELPSIFFASLQAMLAMSNWMIMGFLLFTLLPSEIPYTTVLGILLICSIAGIITHIPGGLGVLEAIFISMLQGQLAKSSILAALIAYRILYFLIPLAVAIVIYAVMEIRAKKMKSINENHKA